jgi:type VI secretion system protein VasG
MEDGEGRRIDFKNTIILLTSNVGSDLITRLCMEAEEQPVPEDDATALRPSLLKVFPAALLGRLTVVPYYPLDDGILKSIIQLQLSRIEKRLLQTHGTEFTYTKGVIELISARCTELESGGRMIDAILTQTLLPDISREFLNRLIGGTPVRKIHVLAGSDGSFLYQFDGETTAIRSAQSTHAEPAKDLDGVPDHT